MRGRAYVSIRRSRGRPAIRAVHRCARRRAGADRCRVGATADRRDAGGGLGLRRVLDRVRRGGRARLRAQAQRTGRDPLLFIASAAAGSSVPWFLGSSVSDIVQGPQFLLFALLTGPLYMLLWPAALHLSFVFPYRLRSRSAAVAGAGSLPGGVGAYFALMVGGWLARHPFGMARHLAARRSSPSSCRADRALAIFVRSYRRTTDDAAKNRMRWAAFGAVASGVTASRSSGCRSSSRAPDRGRVARDRRCSSRSGWPSGSCATTSSTSTSSSTARWSMAVSRSGSWRVRDRRRGWSDPWSARGRFVVELLATGRRRSSRSPSRRAATDGQPADVRRPRRAVRAMRRLGTCSNGPRNRTARSPRSSTRLPTRCGFRSWRSR